MQRTACFQGSARAAAILISILTAATDRAATAVESAWEMSACKAHSFAGSAGEGSSRRYAPDRLVDVLHVQLDVTPDFDARSIAAKADIRFAPVGKPLAELALDAVGLVVTDVESSVQLSDYHVTDDSIVLSFAEPIAPGAEASVTLVYTAQPEEGMYFRTPELGYAEGDEHLWTQGEPERHRFWFPSYDYPNERFTTEVICHVPTGMTALSNGRLVSETADPQSGTTAFHWLQDKPHVNYLVSLVAGNLRKLEDTYRDIPLAFWTPPSDFEHAANSFRDTKAILAFFEREIGVDYPWDKYFNVCVQDFIAGGMENTSITTLTTRTLFSEDFENLRTTRRLDAHETAHQWFGDLVTCKDWSHLWLNEGFATYYTHLFEGEKFGRDEMLYGLLRDAERIFREGDNDKPIVYREYKDPWEQFDYRAYPKGSWVLHMLRSQLGPELFRGAIRTYLERNQFESVVTEDLNSALEDVSGRSLDRFFDQWVYHGGYPKLKANYGWDAGRAQASIKLTQTQTIDDARLVFAFPLPVRFITDDGAQHDFVVEVTEKDHEFFFALPAKPVIARIDPELTVLAQIDFTPPDPLLERQIKADGDAMGRIHAARAFGKKTSDRAVELLAERLEADEFFGVRIAAADALAEIGTPAAFDALRTRAAQDDARARGAVIGALGTFYRAEARDALVASLETESNPDILAVAIERLGKFPDDETGAAIAGALERPSFRNTVASAAIQSLADRGEPAFATAILHALDDAAERFEMRDLGRALEAAADVARHDEPNGEVRRDAGRLIAARLEHPNRAVVAAALRALGKLGDRRHLAAVESFTDLGREDDPVRRAAEEAARAIRDESSQPAEIKSLRETVLDLEKQVRDLTEKVEKLEGQSEPEESDKNTEPASN